MNEIEVITIVDPQAEIKDYLNKLDARITKMENDLETLRRYVGYLAQRSLFNK